MVNHTFTDANQEVVEYDGSPITWRVSAYAVIEQAGRILIIKNKNEKLYDIVGGGIEIGETIEEGLNRETMEEGGAEIEVGELIDTHLDWFYHWEDKKYYQALQLFYLAKLIGELNKPTDPRNVWREFVDIEKIGSEYRLPPIVEEVIDRHLK